MKTRLLVVLDVSNNFASIEIMKEIEDACINPGGGEMLSKLLYNHADLVSATIDKIEE